MLYELGIKGWERGYYFGIYRNESMVSVMFRLFDLVGVFVFWGMK